MSTSIAKSVALDLCRFLTTNLGQTSPTLPAILIYLQKVSEGEFAKYVCNNRERVCSALRAVTELELRNYDTDLIWNEALLSGKLRLCPQIYEMLEFSLPRTMTPDNANRFCEVLSGLRPALLSADDIVFAHEYFVDVDSRQADGAFFTNKETSTRLLAPLFVDEQRAKMKLMRANADVSALGSLADWLVHVKFLDPACGAGNMLIEAKRTIACLVAECDSTVRVRAENFLGIELNAETAVCAELALLMVDMEIGAQPVAKRCIEVANALSFKWSKLTVAGFDYIIGNPPFLGAMRMDDAKRVEMRACWGAFYHQHMDYVSCWFKKAADYIERFPNTKCAFVATDSITQGTQLVAIWETLLSVVRLSFAYESTRWHPRMMVHVVIIGLDSRANQRFAPAPLFFKKRTASTDAAHALIEWECTKLNSELAPHLHPNVPFVNIGKRTTNISARAPVMHSGCVLHDASLRVFATAEVVKMLAEIEADSGECVNEFFHPYINAADVLANNQLYCIDLNETLPARLRAYVDDVELDVRSALREKTINTCSNKLIRHHEFIIVPKTTGKNYRILPVLKVKSADYPVMRSAFACTPGVAYIESNRDFFFGVLQSSMHRVWAESQCGTNGDSMRYNIQVYKSFVWPAVGEASGEAARVILWAKEILKFREQSNLSMHDLYCICDDSESVTVPPRLLVLHEELDRAVDACYGISEPFASDDARFTFLLELYARETTGETSVRKRQTTISEMLTKRSRAVE